MAQEQPRKDQQQQPSITDLLEEEATTKFMEHILEYEQVPYLVPENYTIKEANLSLLSLIGAGAEECAVLYQMNGTVEYSVYHCVSISLSL